MTTFWSLQSSSITSKKARENISETVWCNRTKWKCNPEKVSKKDKYVMHVTFGRGVRNPDWLGSGANIFLYLSCSVACLSWFGRWFSSWNPHCTNWSDQHLCIWDCGVEIWPTSVWLEIVLVRLSHINFCYKRSLPVFCRIVDLLDSHYIDHINNLS